MDTLIEIQNRLVDQLGQPFDRPLESQITWDNRLVVIPGARGVGKTTLLLKHIREKHHSDPACLYASLDNLYFTQHALAELADGFYKKGGRYLFLDEVHKLDNWSRQIKNIYDNYPQFKVVFTGSSILNLLQGQADLSRRAVSHTLNGLSFREYLQIETSQAFSAFSLGDVLQHHGTIARDIAAKVQPLAHFERYLQIGHYPFYLEGVSTYSQRLQNITNLILEVDLPQCHNIGLKYIPRLKKLLYLIAISAPMKPNISKLSTAIEVSRQTVSLYLDYLQQVKLIRLIRSVKRGHGLLTKPEKVLLHNTNLAHTLAKESWHPGNVREIFFVNQVSQTHDIQAPERGDFLIDDKWTIEVGGKNKDSSQITGLENAFIAADDIETGYGNKIPLWLFGFLA
ncbi:ATP-binding protein [Planctomycetota bacterium]